MNPLEVGVAIYNERALAIMKALNASQIPRDATSGLAMLVASISVIRQECPNATIDEVIGVVRVVFTMAKPEPPAGAS